MVVGLDFLRPMALGEGRHVTPTSRRLTMSDEPQQHDEPVLPDDAVEDLAPEGAEEDVSGGAVDSFIKLDDSVGDKG
jgi:hypothetical protein